MRAWRSRAKYAPTPTSTVASARRVHACATTTSLYWLGTVNKGARPVCGLFKPPPFHDPKLGQLVRSRGLWRGLLTVEAGVSAPLALSGTRTEPHAQALAAAREEAQEFASWRPAIEQALFEHYEPYAEAVTAREFPSPSETSPRIAVPGD